MTEDIPTSATSAELLQPTRGQFILILRLITLVLLVALLTCHIRTLRVFRWEQSFSGGMLVTYTVAVLALALGTGLTRRGEKAFQAYICASGCVLLGANACVIYRRWRRAGELTRMVAELLGALGVPLRRQVLAKVILSAAAAMTLLIDLILGAILMSSNAGKG